MKNTVLVIALAIVGIVSVGTVMSDSEPWERDQEDDHEDAPNAEAHRAAGTHGEWPGPRADVAPAQDASYTSACGACHFAYQPGLLPGRAWARIMDSLGKHYGDDASLDGAQSAGIRRYLIANAADRSTLSRSRAFAVGSGPENALPRITTTDYFRREHSEIPTRVVLDNPAVTRFGNCPACHRNAEAGIYNEHQVRIPGFGPWDD